MTRPNRITDKKDDLYNDRWATYIYQSSLNQKMRNNVAKSIVNWAFFKNNQWIFEDDEEYFLRDISGNIRNRLRLSHNIIRPMIRRLVGNAIRNDFSFGVTSISANSINRMELRLAKALAMTRLAKDSPFEQVIKNSDPMVGDDEDETKIKFSNYYIDEYAQNIEFLIRNVAERNEFDTLKRELSQSLALDGIGIVHEEEYNGEQIFTNIRLHNFGWDVSARRWDLSDADYMYHVEHLSPVAIAEFYSDEVGASQEVFSYLESMGSSLPMSNQSMFSSVGGFSNVGTQGDFRFPVYKSSIRDGEYVEYGVVKSDDGYDLYTKINHRNSKYTDADLIDSPYYKSVMKDRMKVRVYEDYIREIHFIPQVSFGTDAQQKKMRTMTGNSNLILMSKERMYPEKDSFQRSTLQFPYKVYTWMFDEGEIVSPVDAMIDPQRFVNRVLSVVDHHVNNSNPSGNIIEKDSVESPQHEQEIREGIVNGDSIFIRAGGNVQNSIGKYSAGGMDSIGSLINLATSFQQMTNDIAGNNEGITGTGTSVRASAAVTQNQVFQGTIMQEDFYFALSKIFQKVYQSIAIRGKKIYIDNNIQLVKMVGDRFASHFQLTEDYNLEDFRSFLERVPNYQESIKAGNEQLMMFKNLGMLDDKMVSDMWNKSTPREVGRGLAEYAVAKIEAQKQQQAMAEQQQSNEADAFVAQQQVESTQRELDSVRQQDMSREKLAVDLLKSPQQGGR